MSDLAHAPPRRRRGGGREGVRALQSALLCLTLGLQAPAGFAQTSDCIYLGDRAIGCDQAPTVIPAAAASRTYPPSNDDVLTNDDQQPNDQPPDRHDGGGRNWLLPAIVVGVAALVAVNQGLKKEKEQVDRDDSEGTRQLLRDGPQLPRQFNTSAMGIRGLLRGGWPIVVDYEQLRPGRVELRIGIPGAEVITYRLDQFGLGRHLLRFNLPSFLGDGLKPALIAVTAVDPDRPDETLGGFRVYGVGIGPRAVGSIAVDRLEFAPDTVSVGQGQTAGYGFHSKSTFDNAAVEFMLVSQTPDGVHASYVNGLRIRGGVRQDAWFESADADRWDGHDAEKRVSEGRHQLQVRVWDDGGDWVGAWSDALVTVR